MTELSIAMLCVIVTEMKVASVGWVDSYVAVSVLLI